MSPDDAPPAPWLSEASIWQQVESGSYRVDLPVWTRLSSGSETPILDLGCGTGRVAHHLAAAGNQVTGIECDPGIAADFGRLAVGDRARVLIGDALELGRLLVEGARFDRIILPQQLIQIIGDDSARSKILPALQSRLNPGGTVAFALVPDLPESSTELVLPPDELLIDGWVFSSRPVSIEATDDRIELTRIRERISPTRRVRQTASVITFRRLDPDTLFREASLVGLEALDRIEIPATALHMGSVICVCRRSI